jgi:hypothetical protein
VLAVDPGGVDRKVVQALGVGKTVARPQGPKTLAREELPKTSSLGQVSTRTIPSSARRQRLRRMFSLGISAVMAS